MKKNKEQAGPVIEPSLSIEGDSLVIRLPIKPKAAASGKNLVIAGSGGNRTTVAKYKGKPVNYQATAWVGLEGV